ncbi:MAG: hypothetical protein M3355_01465 [Actinomycetota bacterium]|nr:hypothetical protein [Actinomycetota bacterium]
MDASRVRQGEMIAAAAAVALFIIMFLAWFSVPGLDDETQAQAQDAIEQAEELGIAVPEDASDAVDDAASISAFDAFDFIKIVLLLTIIAAIALAAMSAMGSSVNLPVAMSAIVAGLGILSTLLILYRVIDPVGGLDRSYGLFLGLLAAAGIAYGGWRAMQEEGTSFQGEADRLQTDRGTDHRTGPGAGSPPPPPPSGPAA